MFKVSTFIVFIIVAVITGTIIIWKQAKEKLYDEAVLFDTVFLTLFSGIFFARFGYILLHLDVFEFSFLRWIAFWVFPGFYLYTGLLGAVMVLWIQSRKVKEFNLLDLLDIFGFAFLISTTIGQLGSFLGGIEQGVESSIHSISHPVSLYKFIVLLIFITPYLVFRYEYTKDDWFHKTKGAFGLSVLSFFSINTFLFDFFKQRTLYLFFSIDQWITLCIFVVSVVLIYILLKRTPRKDYIFIKKTAAKIIKTIKSKRIIKRKKR